MPKVLDNAARTPKELARRGMENAKEKLPESVGIGDSPENYAAGKAEAAMDTVARKTGDAASDAAGKIKEQIIKRIKGRRDESFTPPESRTERTAPKAKPADNVNNITPKISSMEQPRSQATEGGRRQIQQLARERRALRNTHEPVATPATVQNALTPAKSSVKTASKGTIKTANKSVKSTKNAVKATSKSIKTAKKTAKTTAKTAKQTAKATERAAKAAKAAAKTTAQAAKATAKAVMTAIKMAIAAIKALISAIAASGWIAVLVITVLTMIIILLVSPFSIFMGDNPGDTTGTNPDTNAPIAINIPQTVLRYKPIVERECIANGIPQYVDTILAIMTQESYGKLPDVMQSSESMGLPPNSLEPEPSIVQGVKYFKGLLDSGAQKGVDFYAVLQSYNYGGGYIGFIAQNGGIHTQALADLFSDQQAAKLGWSNYGDKLYVPHVTRYLQGMGAIVVSNSPIGNHLNGLYAELFRKIGTEASNLGSADASEIVYDSSEGDSQFNPADVLAIFSVKATVASDNPVTLVIFDPEQADILTKVFWDMYSLKTTYTTRAASSTDEDGNTTTTTQRVKIIHVIEKSIEDMQTAYAFTPEHNKLLDEILSEPYRSMLSAMVSNIVDSDLAPAEIAAIINSLPPGKGSEIVKLALSRLGHPYSQPKAGTDNYVDCSFLTQWCQQLCCKGWMSNPLLKQQGRPVHP